MPFLSTYTYLPTYLPTYLIIPSGPLEAISDLHTERRDGFTARLCTIPMYTCNALHRRTLLHFPPIPGSLRKNSRRYATPRVLPLLSFPQLFSRTSLVATTNN